ncbi:hypothetical protein FBU30_003621 [Linnemannia zychae]|nr:hypothetical protein FBU30_003621 [Linnemannia zychae]
MEYRYLGNSGLMVSALSLGGWVTYGGQVSPDVAQKCMKTAFDLGINFFDTAEVYAGGQCEIDMGVAIRKFGWARSDLVISTKLFWGGKGRNERGLSRKHIIEGTDASLKRLQLDYVDLLYAHRPDPDTPMEEIVRAFNHVINQGKAFYWGTSEWSAQQITEAHAVAARLNLIPPLMEQPQYNMFHRDRVEKEYLPLFKNYKMGATIWSPLASGLLSGKYNEGIPSDSRLAIQDNAVMKRLREALDTDDGRAKIAKVVKLGQLAKRLDCTTSQLALAWCLKNPNISSVITGASKPSQIEENVKALQVVPLLTDEIMTELEEILANKPALDYNFPIITTTLFAWSLLFSSTTDATALTYNVGAHERACFYAWVDIPKKKLAFYFAVQSGGSFDIDVEVRDPKLKPMLMLEKERQGDFVFTANEVGEYSFCFSNDMSTFAEKMVDFEISVENEKRPTQVDQDEKGKGPQAHADAMDESLFRLTGELARIDRMQKYFRTRENRNFFTVISTDSRIFWFSLTESAMIVAMAMVQVYVVRTFFSGSRRHHV